MREISASLMRDKVPLLSEAMILVVQIWQAISRKLTQFVPYDTVHQHFSQEDCPDRTSD